jgi:uncharacterized protein involved in response to NO
MAPIARLKPYEGAVFFSYGFRPFFFFAASYGALAIAIWLPVYFGEFKLQSHFVPRDWHVHEMLFGYIAAAMTGFLLTAIPNWTGRLPLQGGSLVTLVVLWCLGRVAVTFSAVVGWAAAMIVDTSFLTILAMAAAREIVAGQNWRNLKVLIPLGVFACANISFHLEAHIYGAAELSLRIGIAAVVFLLMLIGGRVVPSFTRNWLSKQQSDRLPAPFGWFDAIAIVMGAMALLVWIVVPDGKLAGSALIAAALMHLVRLTRWVGERTGRDWLVLVLHVAYGFIPIGFGLLALAALQVAPHTIGIHALMVGGAGTMTLAVMTRASLGHTGRVLFADPATRGIYVAIVCAALARIAAAIWPDMPGLLTLSACGWLFAFGGFALLYGPVLFGRDKRRPAVQED